MMIKRLPLLSSSLDVTNDSHRGRLRRLWRLGAPALMLTLGGGFVGCEKPDRCTVNSECGNLHLCRAGVCKIKCDTYVTCDEGEACVDGACEVPSADYCSHVVPAQTPPEMGPYEPCPPSEPELAGEMIEPAMSGADTAVMTPVDPPVETAGEGATETSGEAAGATAGEGVAGEGVTEVAGDVTIAGASSVAGDDSTPLAGATAGESSMGTSGESAGEVIEVIGGQGG